MNALKVVSMRLRGTTTKELESAGEDTDGLVENTSKLYSKLKTLTAVNGKEGISILGDDGRYKSTYEILTAIADRWDEITAMGNDSAILELMAGKTRGSVVAALLQQPDVLKNAYVDALNAEGSALAENEKYLDSIQGRIDLFTNSVQSMWSNALDDDIIKWFVNLGTRLVNLVDNIGMIQTAFILLGTYLNMKYLKIDFSKMFDIKNLKNIPSLLTSAGKSIKSLVTEWKSLGTKGIVQKGLSNVIKSLGEKLDVGEYLQSNLDNAKAKYLENPLDASNKQNLDAAQQTFDEYNKLFAEQKAKIQSEINIAEQDLLTAQEDLQQYWSDAENGGGDLDQLKKYQENVDIAKEKLKALNIEQQNLGKTGKGAFSALGQSVKDFSKQLSQALTSMAAMYLISKVMSLIQTGFEKITSVAKESKEKYEQLTSELSDTKSKLKDIQTQLDDVNGQIKEISNNTPLTFTDTDELSRLKEQSNELQRQIDLAEKLQEQQQKGVNEGAITATSNYMKTNKKSGKTSSENISDKAGTGAGIGAATGVVTGVGGVILGGALEGTALAAWAGPIGMLIGAAVGAVAGIVVGAAVGATQNAFDEEIGDSLDNMKENYDKLKQEYTNAQVKYQKSGSDKDYKKLEEAQNALNSYESEMSSYLTALDTEYSNIDWKTATTEQRKALQDFYDTQDKWAIQSESTNAKSNAFARLFGENADDVVKQAKQEYIDAINDGKSISLKEAFGDNTEAFEELKNRFYDMGLYVADAESYLKDFKNTEEELSKANLYDLASSTASAEDAISALSSAFEEASETGQISAKTIKELYKTFGSIEGITEEWENYVNTMMSGISTTGQMTEATEKLAEAWLDESFLNGPLDAMEKMSVIASLTRMGVTNAAQYVDDAQKEAGYEAISNAIKGKTESITTLKKKKTEATDENGKVNAEKFTEEDQKTLDALNKDLDSINQISIDQVKWIQELAKQYGLTNDEVQQYINLLAEKAKLESQQEELNSYNSKKQEKENLDSKISELENNQYTSKYTGKSFANPYSYYDSTGNEVSKEEYEKWKTNLDNMKSERDKLQAELDANPITYNADELKSQIDEIDAKIKNEFTEPIEMKIQLSDNLDEIQSAYSTLNDVIKQYNSKQYLSLDNLQALLSLKPEYLALLQMENGQLSFNQSAMETMIQTRLNEAKATAVQEAITQLNALAARTEAEEVANSGVAASNAISGLGAYANALSIVSQDAIVAANSVSAFNAAVAGAQGNELVSQNEIDTILSNLDNQLNIIDSVGSNLHTNFDSIVNPSSSSSSAKDKFDDLVAKYNRELELISNEKERIQAEIDKAEARGEIASESYYKRLIELEEQEKQKNIEKQKALQKYLDANGDAMTQEEWADANNEINDTALAIKECEKNIIDFGNAIEDIHWEYFEKANDEIEGLADEIDFVRSLFEDDDVADENGNWTASGITQAGLYMQQMEQAAAMTKRYGEEIDKVNKSWSAYQKLLKKYGDANKIPQKELDKLQDTYGSVIRSESEYQEKLTDLQSKQRNSVKSYEDAKDAIVDLNKARVDAIKDGIDKEIDAYKELIDLKKEELSAEKD